MSTKRSLALAVALIAPAGAADAQELLNGSFDEDITYWNDSFCDPKTPIEECLQGWSDLDRYGSGSSGSLRLRKDYSAGVSWRSQQCIDADAGQTWGVTAWTYLPNDSPSLRSNLTLTFWDGAACSGANLGVALGSQVTETDAWREIKVLGQIAPESTVSLLLQVWIYETGAEIPVWGHFDEIKAGIFLASFEDGTTDDWSSVTPP